SALTRLGQALTAAATGRQVGGLGERVKREIEHQLLELDYFRTGAGARLPPRIRIERREARDADSELRLVAIDGARQHPMETPRVIPAGDDHERAKLPA